MKSTKGKAYTSLAFYFYCLPPCLVTALRVQGKEQFHKFQYVPSGVRVTVE